LRLAYQKDYFGGRPVANLKSQIKRNRQNEKHRLRNRVYSGSMRVALKNARVALEAESVEEAREATMLAVSHLDKAAQKGVVHKRNAARRKGRLMKKLAKLEEKA
jgi:small subunit ribosomal protein S20